MPHVFLNYRICISVIEYCERQGQVGLDQRLMYSQQPGTAYTLMPQQTSIAEHQKADISSFLKILSLIHQASKKQDDKQCVSHVSLL